MSLFKLVLSGTALLFFISCEARFDWPWLKNDGPTGKTVTEDRAIEPFSQMKLGVGRFVLDPAVPVGILRITADQGVLKSIRTEVRDGRLNIGNDVFFGHGDIEFRVAPPSDLSLVSLDGVGSLEAVGPLTTSAPLGLSLNGTGKLDLEVEAPSVLVNQNGLGELRVSGKTTSVSITADGVGKVDTSKLITAKAEVSSNGLGEVRVYASGSLKVRADGVGSVRYSGNPTTTDIVTDGPSTVEAD